MKWMFTDFDGTLRNGKGLKANPKDINFVKDFQQRGNKLIIASGRPFNWIKETCVKDYNLYPDYFVANSGSIVTDNQGKILFTNFLEPNHQQEILNFAKQNQDKYFIFVYSTGVEEKILFTNQEHYNSYEQALKLMDLEILQASFDYLLEKRLLCVKVVCLEKDFLALKDHLISQKMDLMFVRNYVSEISIYEIHNAQTNKANGIRNLQKLQDFSDDDVIVVGDDTNDVEMLQEFKNSFIIKQDYNQNLRKNANFELNSLFELEQYIK